MSGSRARVIVVVGVLVLAPVLLGACAPASGKVGTGAAGATTTAGEPDGGGALGNMGTAGGTATARSGGTARPGGHTSSRPPSQPPTGPVIAYFKILQQPKCPEGTAVFRAPAVPLTIAWKVTGATGVELSVDNPDLVGAYGHYPVEGSETFTFSCGGPVGSIETHRYTIYTSGGGARQRADLTASAKVMDAGPGSG